MRLCVYVLARLRWFLAKKRDPFYGEVQVPCVTHHLLTKSAADTMNFTVFFSVEFTFVSK